jgi:hypothetical protein
MNCVLGAVLVRMESLRFVPGAFLFNENLYLFGLNLNLFTVAQI